MDVGRHWHLDDTKTIVEPQILGMAKEINLGAWEGVIWNMLNPPEQEVDNFKFDIFDRSRSGLSGTIGNGAGTGWADAVATADLPMTAAAVGVLTVGDILEVGSEQVIVKAIDRSAYTIDVFGRGHGGTTAASHADTTAFTVIGKAINDTDAKDVESLAERSGIYTNYTQTVFETIDQTFTDELQARKAFEQNPQLLIEAGDRLFRRLSKGCIKGRKSLGTKTVPQTTAGLIQQIAEGGDARTALRYNAGSSTDPEYVLKQALIAIWNAGGNPDTILINPTKKRVFDPLTEQFIRMSRGEASVVGTDNAEAFQFQGKTLKFVQDQDMPTDRIEIVTSRKLYKGWRKGDMLRGPVKEPQDSSRELRFSLQGSYFIIVKGVGVDHIDVHTFGF